MSIPHILGVMAVRLGPGSHTAHHVLLILANHASEHTALAWPSTRTLTEECGLERGAVRAAVAKLLSVGAIERVTDPGLIAALAPDRKGTSDVYRLLITPVYREPSAPSKAPMPARGWVPTAQAMGADGSRRWVPTAPGSGQGSVNQTSEGSAAGADGPQHPAAGAVGTQEGKMSGEGVPVVSTPPGSRTLQLATKPYSQRSEAPVPQTAPDRSAAQAPSPAAVDELPGSGRARLPRHAQGPRRITVEYPAATKVQHALLVLQSVPDMGLGDLAKVVRMEVEALREGLLSWRAAGGEEAAAAVARLLSPGKVEGPGGGRVHR